MSIRILNGALDKDEDRTVLRGVVDPDSLHLLQLDEYQREQASQSKIEEIANGMRTHRTASIDVGMRGSGHRLINGAYHLFDPCFVIDGQRRRGAGLLLIEKGEKKRALIPISVYFDSNVEFEREMFYILNDRSKIKSNKHLENLRFKYKALNILYKMTTSKQEDFVLKNRVQWGKKATVKNLITATNLIKVILTLHMHIVSNRGSSANDLAKNLEFLADTIGLQTFKYNLRNFFETIDSFKNWGGIREIEIKGVPYLKITFLKCFASLLSKYHEFWKDSTSGSGDNHIFQSDDDRLNHKLNLFNVHEPTIVNLASSFGKAEDMLFDFLEKHLQKGRIHKLVGRAQKEGKGRPSKFLEPERDEVDSTLYLEREQDMIDEALQILENFEEVN